jgi:uncharacterized protein (TIGR03790 family)
MMRTWLLSVVGLVLAAGTAAAGEIGPANVYLLVNRKVPQSRELAEHYCKKRSVPLDHIVELDLPIGEDISRADYDKQLAAPLREQLKKSRDKVKVLLCMYGVPLRVGRQEMTAEERDGAARLQGQIKAQEEVRDKAREEVKQLEAKAAKADLAVDFELAKKLNDRRTARDNADREVQSLVRQRNQLEHAETEAAVDSELALLWHSGYALYRWQINPWHYQFPEEERKKLPPVIRTCRLDGPGPEVVRRMIDQAIEVEKKGLSGKVYVDARGLKYDPKADKPGFGYAAYDESLREMARLLEREGHLSVTLDDRGELFAPGSCPDCALYCGWYSLAHYVPCCRFVPGAVAYHIASAEAVSLRDPKAPYWCKNQLADGAVATLGPVAEPYLHAFPRPAELFGMLATGNYTLVECYWRTSLSTSWMMVLVGDPLYSPYAKAPKLTEEKVKPSPAGSQLLFRKG